MAKPTYYPQLYDREWVIQRYATERKSPQEIAAEIGSSDVAVRNALRRFEIPRRGATESRDLTREDVERWAAKGGAYANHPIGPKEHKAAAEELGISSVDDLIVWLARTILSTLARPAKSRTPSGSGSSGRGTEPPAISGDCTIAWSAARSG